MSTKQPSRWQCWIQTPHRFRTKRQLWAYSGLALETRISAEYCYVEGQLRRSKKLLSIRGLNKDHNHDLKGLFKAAAIPRVHVPVRCTTSTKPRSPKASSRPWYGLRSPARSQPLR